MATSGEQMILSLHRDCHFDLALKLLNAGTDPRAIIDIEGEPLIHHACAHSSIDTIKLMIENHGYSLMETTSNGELPIHWASIHGQLDNVKYILENENCADTPDKHGQTALYFACQSSKLDLVKYLIEEKHCSPKLRTTDGQTLLHSVCTSKALSLELLRYLIEEKQCSPYSSNVYGQTVIHTICSSDYPGALELLKYLVDVKNCDPNFPDGNAHTPLHLACKAGVKAVVDYLADEKHCSVDARDKAGLTPLHIACESSNLDIVAHLVKVKGWNPTCKDSHGNTPLHIICKRSRDCAMYINAVTSILSTGRADISQKNMQGLSPLQFTNCPSILHELLKHDPAAFFRTYSQEFEKHSSGQRPEPLVPIFVLGDPAAGKSTLVEALQSEASGLRALAARVHKVCTTSPQTAGIIPYDFESKKYGAVTLYDLAGQREFYSSHAALLETATRSTAPIFIIVVDMRGSELQIKNTLLYWLTFIDNQCKATAAPPHIIIVGSHTDEIKEKSSPNSLPTQNADPGVKLSQIVQSLCTTLVFISMYFTGYLTGDCRKTQSQAMTRLRDYLEKSCTALRREANMDDLSHCLLLALSAEYFNSPAITLGQAVQRLKSSKFFSLPESVFTNMDASISELMLQVMLRSCKHLHNHGHLLFLRNERESEKSWLVLDRDALLSGVTGTIFAPEGFQQHSKLASSTGVVPLSKMAKLFPKFDTQLILRFLSHLEFCTEITDPHTLKLLSESEENAAAAYEEINRFDSCSHSVNCGNQQYYFFPGLVSMQEPEGLWQPDPKFEHRCGWLLQCKWAEHYLTPRFLQVLLLRLGFSFALTCNAAETRRALTLQRKCSIWKNGIYWANRDGIEALVEVTDKSRTVCLLMRCLKGSEIECARLRSSIIQMTLAALEQFCPKVMAVESVIDPAEAVRPLKPYGCLTRFTVQEIARAIAEGKHSVVNEDNRLSTIDNLLFFEPYRGLNKQLIAALFESDRSAQEVSDIFLYDIANCIHDKMNHFINMFNPPADMLQNMIEQAPPGSVHATARVFQLWRLMSSEGSYECLRRDLDKYSVFTGRNPLVRYVRTSQQGHKSRMKHLFQYHCSTVKFPPAYSRITCRLGEYCKQLSYMYMYIGL